MPNCPPQDCLLCGQWLNWKPFLSEWDGSHIIKINQDLRSNQSKIKNHLLSESYGSGNRGRWSPNRNELHGQGAEAWKRKVGQPSFEREKEIWSKICKNLHKSKVCIFISTPGSSSSTTLSGGLGTPSRWVGLMSVSKLVGLVHDDDDFDGGPYILSWS